MKFLQWFLFKNLHNSSVEIIIQFKLTNRWNVPKMIYFYYFDTFMWCLTAPFCHYINMPKFLKHSQPHLKLIELVVKKQQTVTSKPDIKTTPLWSRFVQLVSKVFVLCQNNLSLAQRIYPCYLSKTTLCYIQRPLQNILKLFWCKYLRKYLYFSVFQIWMQINFIDFLKEIPLC